MGASSDESSSFANLLDAFTKATENAEDGILQCPGSAGLAAIFVSAGFEKDIDKIKESINSLGWDEERDYDLDDWQILCTQVGCDKDPVHVSNHMDTPNDDDNKLADAIQSRFQRQDFPALLPNECSQAEDQLTADSMLEFVRKVEYAEIQTFIEKHKSAFFKDHPFVAEANFKILEAHWVRDNYYPLVRKYFLQKFVDDGQIAHRFEDKIFLPLLPVISAGDSEAQAVAKKCLAEVEKNDLSEIDLKLKAKWKVVRSAVEGLDQDLLGVCDKFFLSAYYPTFDEVITSRRCAAEKPQADKATPKISVSTGISCGEERRKREELVQQMTKQDFEELEEKVKQKWRSQLDMQSAVVRAWLPQEAPNEFWESDYYPTAFELFSHRLLESRICSSKAQVVPKVAPSDGCNSAVERSKREALLPQITKDLAKKIESSVRNKWKDDREKQDPLIMTMLPIEPPQVFWEQEYYTEAFRLISHQSGTDQQHAEISSKSSMPNSEVMGMDSLFASSSQITWSVGNALKDAVEFISSRKLMSSETVEGLWNFEGVLMQHDEAPRSYERTEPNASPLKRKRNESDEPSLSMDVLVADRLGPVMINLKDNSVKLFLEQIADISPSERKPTLKFTNLRAVDLPKNSWNGKILTHMKVLQSNSKKTAKPVTSITRSGQPLSPYMSSSVAYEVPAEAVCFDFLSAQNQFVAPFRVSAFGTIVNVQETTSTSNGSPKVFFHLVDKAGAFILCCAFRHNAGNTAVKNNIEATLYFGTGRNAIGNSPGAIYLMKDALIVPVGMKPMPPTQRVEIVIE